MDFRISHIMSENEVSFFVAGLSTAENLRLGQSARIAIEL